MSKTTKRITTKEDADLFKRVIHLTLDIAEKYEDQRAYKAALEGLYVGLKLYSKKKRGETELDLYLSWFIKTSIEYKLGRKTPDTKIWESKKMGVGGLEPPTSAL